jgi:hypothetical protein
MNQHQASPRAGMLSRLMNPSLPPGTFASDWPTLLVTSRRLGNHLFRETAITSGAFRRSSSVPIGGVEVFHPGGRG